MIDLRGGANDGGKVRGNTSTGETMIDHAQTFIVLLLGVAGYGEVKALSAIQLDINEAWGQNATTEIDDLIWREMQLIEGLLVFEDLAGERVDPEVLLDETRAAHQTTVGELGDARDGGCFAGHDVDVDVDVDDVNDEGKKGRIRSGRGTRS